jgi:hypothetical protein
MRQVASCWLNHPHMAPKQQQQQQQQQRTSSGMHSWATVVATSPPTSGPYLYSERYFDDRRKGTTLEDSPKVEVLRAMSVDLKQAGDATHANGRGNGNSEEDTELEVEALTNSKRQLCTKEAFRKEGAAAPVTPSPFPFVMASAGKSPPMVDNGKPKAKPTSVGKSHVKPIHLPDFAGAPPPKYSVTAVADLDTDSTRTGGAVGCETHVSVGGRVDLESTDGDTQYGLHQYDPMSFLTKLYCTPEAGHSAFSTTALRTSGSRTLQPLVVDSGVSLPLPPSDSVLPSGTASAKMSSPDGMKNKKRMSLCDAPNLGFFPAYSPLNRAAKKRANASTDLPLDDAHAVDLSSYGPQEASVLQGLHLEEPAARVTPSLFLDMPHNQCASLPFINLFGSTEAPLNSSPEAAPVSPRDAPLKTCD